MLGLNTLRARHLSRSGRHTEALAACAMADAYVLSRAGMHLAVLDRARGPSLEHALAVARLGRIDAAVEMGQRYFGRASARTLLGLLAVEAPHLIRHLIRHKSGLDEIKVYCQCASEAADEVEIDASRISAVHGMMLALKAGKAERARTQFERMFWESGLDAPDVEWRPCGIEYKSLACAPSDRPLESETRISVILTAHNEEEMLPVAVQSLLSQSWRNLELIIVNDASTDGTLQVAEAFAARDARVKVVNVPTNVGLWAAKNIGFQQCTGSIITMHDADDWSHSRKLELQAAPLLRDPGLAATSSYMLRVDQQTGAPYTRNARNYLRWNPSSFMFRASTLVEAGGFLDKMLGIDCEFVARVETLYGVDSHAQVRLPLSIGLQRHGSLSNRFRSGAEGLVRLRDWEAWRRRHVSGEIRGPLLRLPPSPCANG